MASAIAKIILTEGLKQIISSITATRYSDAANVVADIQAAIRETGEHVINEISYREEARQYNTRIDSINTWFIRLHEALTVKALDPGDTLLEKLVADIDNNNNGIHFVLENMHTLLSQSSSGSTSVPGLLKLYPQLQLDKRLCQYDDFEMTIYEYLRRIDAYFSEAIAWQVAGNALRAVCAMVPTYKQAYIDLYAQEWKQKLDAQLAYAYNSFHPFLRVIKQDYLTPMDPLQWWRLTSTRESHDNNGRLVCSSDYSKIVVDYRNDYTQSHDGSWKFLPALDLSSNWAGHPPGITIMTCYSFGRMRGYSTTEAVDIPGHDTVINYVWRYYASYDPGNPPRKYERLTPTMVKVCPFMDSYDEIQMIPVEQENDPDTIGHGDNIMGHRFRLTKSEKHEFELQEALPLV